MICGGEKIMIVETNIEHLRDPFVLVENGIYYAYGTGVDGSDWKNTMWTCYKNDSGSLAGEWKKVEKPLCNLPKTATRNRWAPEVHKYDGNFYMIATYFSSETEHRGCVILKSSSPEGEFEMITDGHVTPHNIDAIDGTLYVDKDGTPWLIFVHEWTCTDDGVGRMLAAKLSKDLTHLVSEPIELFRGTDPEWATGKITDGCFMYTMSTGELLMLWSNSDKGGYCVGIAHSDNGRIDGKWTQEKKAMFSKTLGLDYDGGHGMIFWDTDGQMYLSVHSPNKPVGERWEKTIFVPVAEENGTLVCKI